jgi:hypothetical protein
LRLDCPMRMGGSRSWACILTRWKRTHFSVLMLTWKNSVGSSVGQSGNFVWVELSMYLFHWLQVVGFMEHTVKELLGKREASSIKLMLSSEASILVQLLFRKWWAGYEALWFVQQKKQRISVEQSWKGWLKVQHLLLSTGFVTFKWHPFLFWEI